VARYYMRRSAYIAAVNRAQYAVQHYPQAPAVEEAMAILVRAYDALGMADLRDDAKRVLLKNFQKTEHLNPGGPKKRGAPWWRIWDPNW
jgi:outer membrane protein assembly factor BamD